METLAIARGGMVMTEKKNKVSRTMGMWLTFKWSLKWGRLVLSWYVIGAMGVAAFFAALMGNWLVLPIYLFLMDVAMGRVLSAETDLDHAGYNVSVPGMNALRKRLKAYQRWKHTEYVKSNGSAQEAS